MPVAEEDAQKEEKKEAGRLGWSESAHSPSAGQGVLPAFSTLRATESLPLARHTHGASPRAERTFRRQIQPLLLRGGRALGKVKPGMVQEGCGMARLCVLDGPGEV